MLGFSFDYDETTRQRIFRGAGDANLQSRPECYGLLSEGNFIATGGYLDCSFKCIATSTGKVHSSHSLHVDLVTCLSIGEA